MLWPVLLFSFSLCSHRSLLVFLKWLTHESSFQTLLPGHLNQDKSYVVLLSILYGWVIWGIGLRGNLPHVTSCAGRNWNFNLHHPIQNIYSFHYTTSPPNAPQIIFWSAVLTCHYAWNLQRLSVACILYLAIQHPHDSRLTSLPSFDSQCIPSVTLPGTLDSPMFFKHGFCQSKSGPLFLTPKLLS